MFERSKTVVIPDTDLGTAVWIPASIPVKFAPLIAGNVPVMFAAGILVNPDALPVATQLLAGASVNFSWD